MEYVRGDLLIAIETHTRTDPRIVVRIVLHDHRQRTDKSFI